MEKSPHCHSALPLINQAKKRWSAQWTILLWVFFLFFFSFDGTHMHINHSVTKMCAYSVCDQKNITYVQNHMTLFFIFFMPKEEKMVWISIAVIDFMRIEWGKRDPWAPIKKHVCMCPYCIYVCVSKCLNTCEGAVARLVCIDRPCVRHEGRVAICLTANLQRSGEWDQTGGKITPHTPKWETIIPPKVTQTQPGIRIIEQAFCSSFPSSDSPPFSSPHGARRKQKDTSLYLFQHPHPHFII